MSFVWNLDQSLLVFVCDLDLVVWDGIFEVCHLPDQLFAFLTSIREYDGNCILSWRFVNSFISLICSISGCSVSPLRLDDIVYNF